MQRIGPSIPALLLIVLVIGGALLLIAGFGVGVGIGILVGLLIGVVGVGGAFALAQRGRMAMGWTNAVPGQAPDDFDLFRRYGESYARVADVDSGELEGMVAVGDEVDAAGIRVQLVFLELRTNGGIATLATHTRPPVAVPGHFVDVAVRDDAGTQFTAAGQSIGGNTPSTARFEVRFAPAPSGSTLTIHIERFVGPFPGDRSTIDGPWTFVIPLGK